MKALTYTIVFIFYSLTIFSQIDIEFKTKLDIGKQEESAHLFFFDDYFVSISYALRDSIQETPNTFEKVFVFRKIDYSGNVISMKEYKHDTIPGNGSNLIIGMDLYPIFYKNRFILFTEGNHKDVEDCYSSSVNKAFSTYYFDKDFNFKSKNTSCIAFFPAIYNFKQIDNQVFFTGFSSLNGWLTPTIFNYNLDTKEMTENSYTGPGIISDIVRSENGYEFLGFKFFPQNLGTCVDNSFMGNNWICKLDLDLELTHSHEFKYINRIFPIRFEKLGENDYLIFFDEGNHTFKSGYYRYKNHKLVFTNIDKLNNDLINYFKYQDLVLLVKNAHAYRNDHAFIEATQNEKSLWKYTIAKEIIKNVQVYSSGDSFYMVSSRNVLEKNPQRSRIYSIITKFKIK